MRSGFMVSAIILALMLLTTAIPAMSAEKQAPVITVKRPPSKNFPLGVYVQQTSCPDHGKLEALFYEAIRDLRKAIMRFADEYPEYSRLLEISFMNVSRREDAVITFSPAENLGNDIAFTNYTGAIPSYKSGIYVTCDMFMRGAKGWVYGVILHELLHALGLGHAWQLFTDNGEPEPMLYVPSEAREKVYPSTLDLYALYAVYYREFGPDEFFKNVTLPEGMPYKMVIPYDVEFRKLREEVAGLRRDNENLWRALKDARSLLKEFEEANRGLGKAVENLSRENAELKMMNEALMEQLADTALDLQLANQVLERLREENRILKQNLTQLAQMGLQLAEYCNKTILDLIKENRILKANLTDIAEYAKSLETTFNIFRLVVIALGSGVLILVILLARSMRREEAEEEENAME